VDFCRPTTSCISCRPTSPQQTEPMDIELYSDLLTIFLELYILSNSRTNINGLEDLKWFNIYDCHLLTYLPTSSPVWIEVGCTPERNETQRDATQRKKTHISRFDVKLHSHRRDACEVRSKVRSNRMRCVALLCGAARRRTATQRKVKNQMKMKITKRKQKHGSESRRPVWKAHQKGGSIKKNPIPVSVRPVKTLIRLPMHPRDKL